MKIHSSMFSTSTLLPLQLPSRMETHLWYIGVDVEEKKRTMKNKILSFAKRYFTNEEMEVLRAISDPEVQRQEFIKLWTLKEAYVKALGRGFSGAPFNTFTLRSRHANPNHERMLRLWEEAFQVLRSTPLLSGPGLQIQIM
nr:holo-ACP synthase [Tanacetum cinerariifolium]